MKKAIFYGVLLGVLIIPFMSSAAFFSSGVKASSDVMPTAYPDGCAADYKFSITTGHSCTEVRDCWVGDLFSAVTGQPCTSSNQEEGSLSTAEQPLEVASIQAPTCTATQDSIEKGIHWTSSNATAGILQGSNRVNAGVPAWGNIWDLSKDYKDNGVLQGSTLENGFMDTINNNYFDLMQAVFTGPGGSVTCKIK